VTTHSKEDEALDETRNATVVFALCIQQQHSRAADHFDPNTHPVHPDHIASSDSSLFD
jgi:hypothetical protein